MGKFMKYEIKGNYRFILGILAIVIIASTIIQAKILKESNRVYVTTIGDSFSFMDFLLTIAILVMFGSFLVAFFRIIGSFKNELYEDRGYLTFTLPLTGNQILGAKLIVAVLWIIILATVMVLYNLVLATILFDIEWAPLIRALEFAIGSRNIGVFMRIMPIHLILGGISLFGTLILIFLSMALGKVSIRNRKIGGLWFIIFIIITVVASYLTVVIGNTFPLFLDLENLRLLNNQTELINPSYGLAGGVMVEVTSIFTHISLTRILTEILIYIAAFISTGYLIEKKIDI